MNSKDITRIFKRSSLFTSINIIGLAIGLAVSIMLILFVISELSFDKHFKDSDRIISLNTIMKSGDGEQSELPISTRRALTDVPGKVPGIEAATQIYQGGLAEVIYEKERFSQLRLFYTEGSFFDVFETEIIDGNYIQLNNPNTTVITEKYADTMFGSASQAINKTVLLNDREYTIVAVVKEWPSNTHFNFDILANMGEMKEWPSIEFFTFYRVSREAAMEEVRRSIEKEYTVMVSEFLKGFSGEGSGATEKFTDIYLHTKAANTLGSKSDMNFIWLLTIISILILSLAITNFVNLFVSQSELRLIEIGVRKANGADRKDIIKRFFSEISIIVLFAFIIGLILALILLPYFSQIVNRSIEIGLFLNVKLIICITLLFVITVIFSASYPAFYLSKFKTLEILAKRIRFSKRRLAATVVIFQAVISIVLISFILVVNKQTNFLKNKPIYYNPKDVMIVPLNEHAKKEFNPLEQELLKNPKIERVSTAGHVFGAGGSGQGISLVGDPTDQSINEYRVAPGICEIMDLELTEGRFFRKDDPKNSKSIILNEASIRMLGLSYPVVGTTVSYKGTPVEVIGIVKDFIYGSPQDKVLPIALTSVWGYTGILYIKIKENTSRNDAKQIVEDAFRTVDSEFVLSPIWVEDIYISKFNTLELQSKILFYSSILSLLISMLGLLATQSYTVTRRTKEIAIRRINGANGEQLFMNLSVDILKWILIAGVIAIPLAYFIGAHWLENYTNRTSIGIFILIIPVVLQLIIALAVTSGVAIKVISKNPVESLKSE